MDYEIDMLSVGDSDAIALHYFIDSLSHVVVIDGGHSDDGYRILKIIHERYKANYIDLLISTHPDDDHISGLFTIINNMDVKQVWAHDPNNHSSFNKINVGLEILKSKSTNQNTMIVKSMEDSQSFLSLVDKKGIKRAEPFSGLTYGPLTVLGPSQSFYESMLRDLSTNSFNTMLMKETDSDDDLLLQSSVRTVLDEKNETSPINNTSVLVHGAMGETTCLWTGDAGVQALDDARARYNFESINWLDVPHHGSKRNLSSALVEYLKPTISYISAEGSRKHPRRAVVNALKTYGKVYSTHKGGDKWKLQWVINFRPTRLF